MDAATALTLINDELLRNGHAPLMLTDQKVHQAFLKLQQYASVSGRPLEVAIKDLVRFQIQSIELDKPFPNAIPRRQS